MTGAPENMGTWGHVPTIFWKKALRMSHFWILSPPSLRQNFLCPKYLQMRSAATKWNYPSYLDPLWVLSNTENQPENRIYIGLCTLCDILLKVRSEECMMIHIPLQPNELACNYVGFWHKCWIQPLIVIEQYLARRSGMLIETFKNYVEIKSLLNQYNYWDH